MTSTRPGPSSRPPTDGELFTYAGCGHLFADASTTAYDADAAALVQQRVLDFLARV